MKRIVAQERGGPDVLVLVESDVPAPGPGEVRVKVTAAGVSNPDVLVREGKYPDPRVPKPPVTPGYEIVGVVDTLGAGVSGFALGQPVAAMIQVGGYAEYVCVPHEHLVIMPEGIDPASAVCMPLNYLTAHQILKRTLNLQAGQRLLIHGAAGGVGTALLELGARLGRDMYGTASARKHDLVRALGGTPIDYHAENFQARVLELTDGEGVDAVVDHILGWHMWQSYRTLRRSGALVPIGVTNTVGSSRLQNMLLMATSLVLLGVAMLLPDGRMVKPYSIPTLRAQHPDWHRADMTELFEWLQAGTLKPVIAEQMPLDEARRAHEMLAHRQVEGRIALVMD